MSGPNGDYPNSKVGILQDADTIFADADGYFNFAGNRVTGQQLNDALYLPLQKTIIANSAGALSVINLPSTYGVIQFSLATAASNASAWLTSSPRAGQELILMMLADNSVASVFISTSGCTIIGNRFTDVSSLSLQQSAASNGFIRLKCFSAGVWSVIERNGATVERVSS
jgi:hypothetical protein